MSVKPIINAKFHQHYVPTGRGFFIANNIFYQPVVPKGTEKRMFITVTEWLRLL
jgi:hypothetical protein